MKNKVGILSGFIIGIAGFLFLFKVIVLNNVSPTDELAPGIVVLVSILSGILFAFIGARIQHNLVKKRN